MKQNGLATVGSALRSTRAITDGWEKERVVYKVNTEQSIVVWNAKKVTGQHHGNVDILNGEIIMQDNSVLSAEITLDMNTIINSDLSDSAWNGKLVGHLKSDDFFSVDKNPYVKFAVTSFSSDEKTDGEENFTVTGDLTIKGITHEISFPAVVELNNSKITARGKAIIDRTNYDIRYGSGSFFKGLGDNLIYNDFEIDFEMVAELAEPDMVTIEQ